MSLLRFVNITDIKRALRNPGKAMRVIRRSITASNTTSISNTKAFDPERIATFSSQYGMKTEKLESFLEEFRKSTFQTRLDQSSAVFADKPYGLGGMKSGGETAYLAARILKPESIVEVGVGNGVSTLYLLAAAEHGEFGPEIHGIDMPQFEGKLTEIRGKRGLEGVGGIIPDTREAGWIAPRRLRRTHGYQYHVGDFMAILPSVLQHHNKPELAIYDASKDAEEMKFAYGKLLTNLASDGVLISDDIEVNSVFRDVCAEFDGDVETIGGCGIFFKGE